MNDETYRAARAAFEAYAAMHPPELPADTLSALQVRLARWETRNFGWQPTWTAALGVAEEVGELFAAKTDGEIGDAVADICVFAAQICTGYRLDFGVLLSARCDVEAPILSIPVAAGQLCRTVLKEAQRIRGMGDREAARHSAAGAVHALVSAVACAYPWARIEETYAYVAERVVLKRNWTTNPTDGVTA